MSRSAIEELDYLLRTEFGLIFTPNPIHTDAVVVMDNRSGKAVSSATVAHVLSILPDVLKEAKEAQEAALDLRLNYHPFDSYIDED